MRAARLGRFGVDPIARLRRIRGDAPPEASDLNKAARTVFATKEGRMLLDWMLAQSYGRTVTADAPESALRENEARKRFFDQFLALGEEQREAKASIPKTARTRSRSG